MRDLKALPKAHLHLHFTGSMRITTLRELAAAQQIRLPENFSADAALHVPANQRGWFRFQRAYDAARKVVRSESTMRRIIHEAAADERQEGSKRLEIQIDPTSYAPFVGGITPALEIVLDAAKAASHDTGVQIGIIVAASRMKHPLDAAILARLAAKYAGAEPGCVVGFGLSNDERRGETAQWAKAFRIARKAGLAAVPHGGELLGPQHLREIVEHLHPARIGHGVRAVEDPALLQQIVDQSIALEVCPASNVHLGVYQQLGDVPLRNLLDAGVKIALGADDPLLFRSRLAAQYEAARTILGFSDSELATLARCSIEASLASPSDKQKWYREIDSWLLTSDEASQQCASADPPTLASTPKNSSLQSDH
ncbi:adenosine deaminase [Arcanobacterium hippocoleae]|nr:adenosine deaminase [Arcanobacterium hippocoleae]